VKKTTLFLVFMLLFNGFIMMNQFMIPVSAASPTVSTDAATSITATSATLNGELVNDGGKNCTIGFEYGTSDSYGNDVTVNTEVTAFDINLEETQDDGGIYKQVWGDDSYIYTTCSGEGIRAYSFDGSSFSLEDTQYDGDYYQDVWGDGTYVFVANMNDGLRAYSFDGATFTLKDTQDDGGYYTGVWADDSYIFTACTADGLRAYSFNS